MVIFTVKTNNLKTTSLARARICGLTIKFNI